MVVAQKLGLNCPNCLSEKFQNSGVESDGRYVVVVVVVVVAQARAALGFLSSRRSHTIPHLFPCSHTTLKPPITIT